MTNQRKLLYLIILLILISGVIFYLRGYLNKKYSNNTPSNNSSQNQTEAKSDGEIQLAKEYPTGITEEWVLEPKAVIVTKSDSESSTGVQGTLIYESKLSQNKAASGYEDFLKKKGFTTTYKEDKNTGIININAVKDNVRAYIVVDENDISKIVTIDVTVVTEQVSKQPTK